MQKKHFLVTILLIVFPTNTIVACAIFQPAKPPSDPIRMEFTQRWGDYTLVIAREKGFFEKYGVQVEPVYYENSFEADPDLAAGQIDGALITLGDIINIDRSAEMKVVATSDDGGAGGIVANPAIHSIQDLKGKTVGVMLGTSYELMISEMLRSVNMGAGDISVENVKPEDAVAALDNKKVQAVYTWEPFLSTAIAAGNQLIFPEEQLRLFPTMIVFSRSMVDERPGDIRAFLQAWFEAVEYRRQNPELTRAIAANYLEVGIEELQPDGNLKILGLNDNKALFSAQNENSVYSITQRTSDYLISIGAVSQQVDPFELLDPAYLP